MDPKKIELVKNWPAPTNVQELQGFLGFANYFHKFIWGWALCWLLLCRACLT